jgi:uncharacterized protein (DUF2147 family)
MWWGSEEVFDRKMRSLLIILWVLAIPWLAAQDIAGRWTTIDDRNGQPRSVVEITVKNGIATGRIVEIFEEKNRHRVCERCPDDRRGHPMLGLEIIRNMKRSGKEWTGGTLLDPDPGKIYDGKLWIDDGKLKVRGYVAFFYRTQTWVREK